MTEQERSPRDEIEPWKLQFQAILTTAVAPRRKKIMFYIQIAQKWPVFDKPYAFQPYIISNHLSLCLFSFALMT